MINQCLNSHSVVIPEAPLRRLFNQSAGLPLRRFLEDGHVHESVRSLLGSQTNAVTVHWDRAARLAAALAGAHACCCGNRVYLGPAVGTAVGPRLSEALHHELAHLAQMQVASNTGVNAPRAVLEAEAHGVAEGRPWGVPVLHGADPQEIYTLWWLIPLAAALYVMLRPNVANAPAPGEKTYKSVSEAQVAGEAFALFAVPEATFLTAGRLGLGFYGGMALAGASTTVSLRAVNDVSKGQFSGVQAYVFDGATGALIGVVVPGGIRLIGSGATRSLDWLATQGMRQSDFAITRTLAQRAANSPITQSEIADLFSKRGLTGKAAEWWLERRGTMILYRGQAMPTARILSPLARESGLEASQRFVAEMRAAGLTDEEIAGYTARWHTTPVPPKLAPPGMGGQALGAAGIPTTRLPGLAADFGESGVVYIIRLPKGGAIQVPQWGLSVENEFVILNEIPPGSVVGKVRATSLPALEADEQGRLILRRRVP